MVKDQNIYEYKKVKILDKELFNSIPFTENAQVTTIINANFRVMRNKINELAIEQNHLMKDFELYKKAFKDFLTEMRKFIEISVEKK